MSLLYQPSANWIGRVMVPPGFVPPSPPAQQRRKREEEAERQIRPFRCPGLAPAAWREYREAMPVGSVIQRLPGKPEASGPTVTGTKAYWKFDNNFADSSGNGNTLLGINTPGFTTGKIAPTSNGALSLVAGSSQNAGLAFADAQFANTRTLAGWINLTTSSNCFLVTKYDFTGSKEYRVWRSGSNLQYDVNANGSVATVGTVAFTTATWHYVVFTWDNSAFKGGLSLDGANLSLSSAQAGGVTGTSVALQFGIEVNGGVFLTGLFDGWGVWDHQWSNTEISAGWNSGNGTNFQF